MSKLKLTKKEGLALNEFKKKILQKLKGEVLDIKLFGSKARGDFKMEFKINPKNKKINLKFTFYKNKKNSKRIC